MNQNENGHVGTCHCGAVRFRMQGELAAGGSHCNCSVCTKVNAFGRLLKPEEFELLAGEGNLTSYEWGHRVSRRYFCKNCGVTCFGRGHLAELGGDFVSINLNCLDGVELSELKVMYWDGRHDNWAGARDEPWPVLGGASPS